MKRLKISLFVTALLGTMVACSADQNYGDYSGSSQNEMVSAADQDDGEESKSANNRQTLGYIGSSSTNQPAAHDIMTPDGISDLMSSSAATANFDSSHQFIRTADVRFRVNDVRSATFRVEKITANFGGYVAHTGLESEKNYVKETKVSDDSTLVTTYYTVTNNMTLRVPAENLDSTLRTLGSLVEYLDHRRIHVEDVTLRILRENLAARQLEGSSRRLEDAVDKEPAKLRDRAAVEEALFRKKTQADESYLKKLEILDQIKLSTISLSIYQNKTWTQEMIANEKSIDAYRPGFFHDVGVALNKGWEGLKAVVIGLLHIWPMFLIIFLIVGGALFIRRRQNRKAK